MIGVTKVILVLTADTAMVINLNNSDSGKKMARINSRTGKWNMLRKGVAANTTESLQWRMYRSGWEAS